MSAIAVVVTPLEGGTPVEGICRDRFVAHRIALTRMESLICELHLPELNEPSRASTRLGPELGNLSSVRLGPEPSEQSRAGSAHFAKPDVERVNFSMK